MCQHWWFHQFIVITSLGGEGAARLLDVFLCANIGGFTIPLLSLHLEETELLACLTSTCVPTLAVSPVHCHHFTWRRRSCSLVGRLLVCQHWWLHQFIVIISLGGDGAAGLLDVYLCANIGGFTSLLLSLHLEETELISCWPSTCVPTLVVSTVHCYHFTWRRRSYSLVGRLLVCQHWWFHQLIVITSLGGDGAARLFDVYLCANIGDFTSSLLSLHFDERELLACWTSTCVPTLVVSTVHCYHFTWRRRS